MLHHIALIYYTCRLGWRLWFSCQKGMNTLNWISSFSFLIKRTFFSNIIFYNTSLYFDLLCITTGNRIPRFDSESQKKIHLSKVFIFCQYKPNMNVWNAKYTSKMHCRCVKNNRVPKCIFMDLWKRLLDRVCRRSSDIWCILSSKHGT